MIKKIGICLILAFTMLVSTFNVRTGTSAYATAPCTTLEECRELQRRTRDNISEIIEEEEEVSADIAEVQDEIKSLRDGISGLEDEITELEGEIADLESEIDDLEGEITSLKADIAGLENEITEKENEIADLEGEITVLEGEITDNLQILTDTEESMEVLIEEIAERMRITQRVNNTNSFLTILSEAESIADFVRRTRAFNRFAADDADLMDELNDLIEVQEAILLELEEQAEQLGIQKDQLEDQKGQLANQLTELEVQTNQLEDQTSQLKLETDQLGVLRGDLEAEQANLETDQVALVERETELQDMLYQLNVDRMTQEEMESAVAEAEEILARTPPPPVVETTRPTNAPTTNNTPSNNSNNNTSPTNAPANNPTTNNAQSNETPINNASNNTPATTSQPTSSSGLAHPMPGARVTSEFGPRGGGHHSGIDLVVFGNQSAPILSSASGTVTINRWHSSLGWYVVVSHNINGQRVDTLYAHLRYQSSVSVGAVVSQGQRIGTKGSTGNSSGPHLHFEVHPGGWSWGNAVNPRNWVGL